MVHGTVLVLMSEHSRPSHRSTPAPLETSAGGSPHVLAKHRAVGCEGLHHGESRSYTPALSFSPKPD